MTSSGHSRPLVTTAVLSALALATAACAADGSDGQGGAEQDDELLQVVASTNAWGSVAEAIGGDLVEVTSLVEDPAVDPHTYESTPEDGLVVAESDLMVLNGGGFDQFAEQFAEQETELATIDAFALSGHGGHDHEEHAHEDDEHGHSHGAGANEHVWYDMGTVASVAEAVADELGELEPESSEEFHNNAASFTEEVNELEQRLTELGEAHPELTVLVTEPVPHYLLQTADLEDITPRDFQDAVEQGSDVPVAAQDEVNQVVANEQADVLINNPQSESPVTQQVVDDAETAGMPVVEITETVPSGATGYTGWVLDQLDELEAAAEQ